MAQHQHYRNVWKNDLSVPADSTVFWFRRDLRLDDNAGLFYALRDNKNVIPIFIFDTEILDALEDKQDARVEFILHSLALLKEDLEKHGSSLLIFYGDPIAIFEAMKAKIVYTNKDYEPYAGTRDQRVSEIVIAKGGVLKSYKDQVIFECAEIVKDDGSPYTIYTPYSRRWKATLSEFYTKSYPTEKYAERFIKCEPFPFPILADLGFEETGRPIPPRVIRRSIIETYDTTRNFPALQGTTRLSVHLRFGTLSIRRLVRLASQKNQVWLNELIWRDFYQMILWHFPHIQNQSFKPAYDRIAWRNDMKEFEAWCTGQTGYPIVDAGMRELNETGFMHNRVRMVVASFLTKHLLIDWRWGEAYFAKKLIDYDLAANNGGWQWAAGTGCDAAPYFRIFNPSLQTEKFDKGLKYIRKWIPELETNSYPGPIVDHAFARQRALDRYSEAVKLS